MTSLKNNLKKINLFHFFRLMVQEDEKNEESMIFCTNFYYGLFILPLYCAYKHVHIGSKGLSQFFLSRREQYMYNGCILILCNMCWENICIEITFNKERSDFDGNFFNNKVQYPKLSRTPFCDQLRPFTVV